MSETRETYGDPTEDKSERDTCLVCGRSRRADLEVAVLEAASEWAKARQAYADTCEAEARDRLDRVTDALIAAIKKWEGRAMSGINYQIALEVIETRNREIADLRGHLAAAEQRSGENYKGWQAEIALRLAAEQRVRELAGQLDEASQRIARTEAERLATANIADAHKWWVKDLRMGAIKSASEVTQSLGKALHYPLDPVPEGEVVTTVCVGDHVPETLADEAAERIRELRVLVNDLQWCDNGCCPYCHAPRGQHLSRCCVANAMIARDDAALARTPEQALDRWQAEQTVLVAAEEWAAAGEQWDAIKHTGEDAAEWAECERTWAECERTDVALAESVRVLRALQEAKHG